MPCDSVILNRVDLKLVDKELLLAALKAMGIAYSEASGVIRFSYQGAAYELRDGVLTGRNVSQQKVGQTADAIRRSYSKQAIKKAANRFGWNVQETDETELVLSRRN
jgi:hypothetical protein